MKKASEQSAAELQALYDRAPYPEILGGQVPQQFPLLTHWVNAASGGEALANGRRLLVAGCGSGEEGLMLARLFPQATVLGVDFSERSIEIAREKQQASGLKNLHFLQADLCAEDCLDKETPFDFILCHGVADYVHSPEKMMANFRRLMRPQAVLCMSVNSPHHPAKQVRQAFNSLNLQGFEESNDQRQALAAIEQLMATNNRLPGFSTAAAAYLDIDIFAPIAHHFSLLEWAELAKTQQLHFTGSMDAPLGVGTLTDEQLPLLYGFGKAELSQWMAQLCQRPGYQMLFSTAPLNEPDFSSGNLLDYCPHLDACMGELPPISGNPEEAKTLTLRFQGLPDFLIYCSAFELEVLRQCKGQQPLTEIINGINLPHHPPQIINCLFRAYHYGVLHF